MRLLAIALLVACSGPAPNQPTVKPPVPQPPPPTPVGAGSASTPDLGPAQPVLRLPRNFVAKSYAAQLSIDPSQAGFTGAIQITGEVKERSSVIWLHGHELKIAKASAGDQALTVTPRGDELLEVRGTAPFEVGPIVLSIDYAGTYATVETAGAFAETSAGAKYVITQFEAIYARRVFPCIDEPDAKVPWQLTLDVPAGNSAVSNTPIAKESDLPGGKHRVEFTQTLPLPSYLVAFGVGPFDIVDAGKTKRGVPVRVIALKGRGAEAAYAAQVSAHVLDLEEAWFQIPYPYPKLDLMAIPVTVGFGAMENAGMITFGEDLLLIDPKAPSWEKRHRYVLVAAHEMAHQWFGDLVTMVWWDDIWLNEGFAEWLESKISFQFEPAWHDDLADIDVRRRALSADSIVSARRIREPIDTIDDIHNVFDGITYQKGATVLNMFEAYIGKDKFQQGVRDYLSSKALGNATSTDFVSAISKAAGTDLGPAFSTFLDQAGAPEIEIRATCTKGKSRIDLVQQRYVGPGSPEPAANTPWIAPICIAYERKGQRVDTCTLLAAEKGSIELAAKTCPRWIVGNAGGRGDYRTRYDVAQATALRDEAWPLLTWTERRAVLDAVETGSEGVPRPMKNALSSKPPAKLSLALELSFIPRMLAGGDRFTIGDASKLAGSFYRIVADDQLPKYEGWLRATFGPGAAKVGLVPKPSDDIDAEAAREDLVDLDVWKGRDPDLVKQANDLVATWRDLPEAVRGEILRIAADADPNVHAKLMHDVHTEADREKREEMLNALGSVRDAKRYEAALELVLDPKLDFRETSDLLGTFDNDRMQEVAEKFLRAHKDAIVARSPKDSVTGVGYLFSYLITASCDAKKRSAIEEFLQSTIATFPGGKRAVAQGLEGLDHCIAYREKAVPEVKAWLSGLKLPPPAAPATAPAKSGKAAKAAKP